MRTVALIVYVVFCLVGLGLLVYWEVWFRTPEAKYRRLQARTMRHCKKMETGKAKLSQMPIPKAK